MKPDTDVLKWEKNCESKITCPKSVDMGIDENWERQRFDRCDWASEADLLHYNEVSGKKRGAL